MMDRYEEKIIIMITNKQNGINDVREIELHPPQRDVAGLFCGR